MEGKTNFSRRLKQFYGLTWLILTPSLILRHIYTPLVRARVGASPLWWTILSRRGRPDRIDAKTSAAVGGHRGSRGRTRPPGTEPAARPARPKMTWLRVALIIGLLAGRARCGDAACDVEEDGGTNDRPPFRHSAARSTESRTDLHRLRQPLPGFESAKPSGWSKISTKKVDS